MPGGPGDRAGAVSVEQRDQPHLPAEDRRARAYRHQMGGRIDIIYTPDTTIDIYTPDIR